MTKRPDVDERQLADRPDNPEDPFGSAPVLGVLAEADRRYLAERSRERRLAEGQILFTQGEASDSVCVLVSGRMNVLHYSRDGAEFIINSVIPGDTIGEVGVLSGGPRSATVQATEPCVVLALPRSIILELIVERPMLAIALLQRLSHMVRRTTGMASDLVFLDLKQRVAKYLLRHATGEASSGSPVTQSALAANIGASRQRVNACLRDFQKQGWITIDRRSLRVTDRMALTKLISF